MKMIRLTQYCFLIIVFFSNCKQTFEPPVLQENLGALVVDGFINNSADTTFIRLSRTKRLSYLSENLSEHGASLAVEDESGNVLYHFQELNESGVYAVPGMVLDFNTKYRLRIFTTVGGEYISDAIPVLKTPPIDSIGWVRDDKGVSIHVNTHDPANNTHYYRWEYSETWQYHASYISALIYDNGLRDRLAAEYVYECWKTQPSKQLLVASTDRLSEDIIYHNTLRQIEQDAIELSTRYFILIKQYALTKEYYQYLEDLKKATEQTGSIFDVQPSALKGNIHAVNNKEEVVIGYLAASTVETQKMFIKNEEVLPWRFRELCAIVDVTGDRVESYFGKGAYVALYFDNVRSVFIGTEAICADCTKKGGILNKPDFW